MRHALFPVACLAVLPTIAGADGLKIVTDIAPIGSLVEMVTNGLSKPEVLVSGAASPHGFALKPSQAAALQEADAVFWVSEQLTPWMETPLEALASGAITVELADSAPILREYREEAEHDDHEGHAAEKHAHEEGHDHSGIDPHLWLDPQNAIAWLSVIAENLSALDPQNAEAYAQNAQTAAASLTALEAELKADLAPVSGRPFLVFHDAYQYFTEAYALTSVGSISLGDAAPTSAAHLSEIQHHVEETGAACAFSEPQFDPRLIAAVSTSLKVAELDPLGTNQAPGPDLYSATLRAMAATIKGCLSE